MFSGRKRVLSLANKANEVKKWGSEKKSIGYINRMFALLTAHRFALIEHFVELVLNLLRKKYFD